MIDKNSFIMKDPMIGDLTVLFTQIKYLNKWEFKKETSPSRTMKHFLSKLKDEDMRKKIRLYYTSALVCIFRKTIDFLQFGSHETKSEFIQSFLNTVGDYVKRIDIKLWKY